MFRQHELDQMSRCTKCKRVTHLDLLDGKPARPDEQNYSLVECEECYGEVPYNSGGKTHIMTFTPVHAPGSRASNYAVKLTEEARRIDKTVVLDVGR